MAAERIDWAAAAAAGDTVELGVLIAGVPHLLIGDGVTVSSVVWTGDADAAWHAGTSPTTRGWLDLPEITIEEKIRPVDGGMDVSSWTLRLADVDLAVTALLAGRDSMPTASLSAGFTAAATSIGVRTTAAIPSSGTIHIGRERITYTGKTSGSITGCTRGTAGTRARKYQLVAGATPLKLYAGDALPSTLGRRVTLWALRFTAAGEVTNPTLLYDGRIGPGTRMSDAGAAWEIPIDHASRALAEKVRPTSVYLYGYSHFAPDQTTTDDTPIVPSPLTPMWARWHEANAGGELVTLDGEAGDPDNGGWSPSAEEFMRRWNTKSRSISSGVYFAQDATGYFVHAGTGGAARRLELAYAWATPGFNAYPTDSSDTATQARAYLAPMTEACVFLQGSVHLDPQDIALIPADPTGTTGLRVQWALEVERDNGMLPKETVRLWFSQPSGSNLTGVTAYNVSGQRATGNAGAQNFGAELTLTKPTNALLRVYVQIQERGVGWWDAMRYGVLQTVDELRGLDHVADAVDWDRVEAIARDMQPWNAMRDYTIAPENAPLEMLRNEAALSGLMLATWRGRIAVARIREPGNAETATRTLVEADLRRGSIPTMREVSDGIISSVLLSMPPYREKDFVRIVDATAVTETGAGAEIKATVPEGAVPSRGVSTNPELRTAVENIALGLIAPWARPYRSVVVPTDLRCAGVEIGDVVNLTEWALPNGSGTRGVAGRAVVVGHRRTYRSGGRGRVDLILRVTNPRAGWAPAYAVDSISGAVVTLDTVYPENAAGFAPQYTAAGEARSDCGLEYLAAGDQMRLVEIGNRTPASPLAVEVLSIDPVLCTVTLTASPGASWETLAGAAYGKVLMVPARHADATAAQRFYVYVADGSTLLLSTGAAARTWS